MNEHKMGEQMSAYLDGCLSSDLAAEFEAHIKICRSCEDELDSLRSIKLRLAKLPQRFAPPELIHQLKQSHLSFSWPRRVLNWLVRPVIWKPAGVLALGLIIAGIWIYTRSPSTQDYVDLDPLLAVHSRYRTETLIHQADLDRTDFSARLASYYSNEE